jgi:hypothetical protein
MATWAMRDRRRLSPTRRARPEQLQLTGAPPRCTARRPAATPPASSHTGAAARAHAGREEAPARRRHLGRAFGAVARSGQRVGARGRMQKWSVLAAGLVGKERGGGKWASRGDETASALLFHSLPSDRSTRPPQVLTAVSLRRGSAISRDGPRPSSAVKHTVASRSCWGGLGARAVSPTALLGTFDRRREARWCHARPARWF